MIGLYSNHVVVRGKKDGSVICHNCVDNNEGFCRRYKKWCSSTRYICERERDINEKHNKQECNNTEVVVNKAEEAKKKARKVNNRLFKKEFRHV